MKEILQAPQLVMVEVKECVQGEREQVLGLFQVKEMLQELVAVRLQMEVKVGSPGLLDHQCLGVQPEAGRAALREVEVEYSEGA